MLKILKQHKQTLFSVFKNGKLFSVSHCDKDNMFMVF